MNKVSVATTVLTCTCALFLFLLSPSRSLALGPNMVANSGFEGGNPLYTLQSPFTVVNDASNAHTGSWEMQASLNRTGHTAYQVFPSWKNTRYTSTIWYKGSGSATFEITSADGNNVLSSKVLTGAPSWRHATIVWNSGSVTPLRIAVADNAGTGTMYFDDLFTGLTDGHTIRFNPAYPLLSSPRYHLLFNDEFNNTSTIDMQNSGAGGYDWYLQSYYEPKYNAKSNMFSVGDGAITFKDSGNPWGEVLDTTHPYRNSRGYIGTAFSGGRGIYFVARIAFENIGSIHKDGWPAWWSASFKAETGLHKDMLDNPGHNETMENDFMEYNPSWGWPLNVWGSTLHDWCDANLANNPNSTVPATVGTDYTKYHTYGVLWVPATVENGWQGYRQTYFDGDPQTAVCWIGNQAYKAGVFPETVESMDSYLFSETDRDQFQLILGSCQGGLPTMKVDYVRVYAVDKSSMTVVSP